MKVCGNYEEEEEEENGTREYLLPYNRVPPSISGGLRNRHCPPPRGDQAEDNLVNAAKAQERQKADMTAGKTGQERNEKGKEPE